MRILACTNRDLRDDVRAGRFREDLYFRLAVVELNVPPLRARREDIAALARAFAARFGARWALDVRLSDALVIALAKRPWPDNVRELENTIARLVAESDGGEPGPEVLERSETAPPAEDDPQSPSLPFRVRVDAFERALIAEAVAAAAGNRAEAARRLGLSRVTLLDRMKRLGL